MLGWCEETDVEVVTLWLLSTDNLDRPEDELNPLLGIIEDAVRDLAADGRWRVHHVGTCDLLPPRTQQVLKEAEQATGDITGHHWSTSRSATAAARRSPTRSARCCWTTPTRGTSFEELAEIVDIDLIAEHLYTRGQPDPDLVIRTQR